VSRNSQVRALLARCMTLACVASLPVGFSAWIDPAHILGAPLDERAIVRALVAGHNVTNVANYDDRAIERLLADQRRERPDILAIGSSRVQAFSAVAFHSQRFVNAAVSGGRLDDILGVIGLYDTLSRRPARVIINLDPWTLQPHHTDAGWGALVKSHAAMLSRLGEPTAEWRERFATTLASFERLASPEYFRLSVFSWRKYGPVGIRFVVTDTAQNQEKTKTPDGTLVWSRVTPPMADSLARAYAAEIRMGTTPYEGLEKEPDANGLSLLERLVRHLRDEGIAVTILLVPFHPLVFDEFGRRPVNPLRVVEARYRDLASRTGASVVGSYDPAVTGMTADDFFDESHLRPGALVRLFDTNH
jgi:hypothetical protein